MVTAVHKRTIAVMIAALSSVFFVMAGSLPAQAQTIGLRQSARLALNYLATQQLPDGSMNDSASVTEDYIFGATAAGRNPNLLISSSGNSVYTFLASPTSGATTTANRTGKLAQALVAGRRNPTNFAGQNILGLLEGPGGTAGGFYNPATGDFFDNDGGSVNPAFEQANAILGLVAAHNPAYPVPAKAVTALLSLQDPNGGWSADGTDNTNSTAMALMALAAVGVHSADQAAFAFLHTQQDPATGGFFFATTGAFPSSASDPDSDALVIQGLVAAGQHPGGAAWTINGRNALTDIRTFQDLQPGADFGGFSFTLGGAPDSFTTSQVPAGLLKSPFPILPRY
ncbi:MAG TPA: prenyltransferase/squalene oxidase repeat-containing protein [Streptosporangiaceae bacterium]